MSSKNLLQIGSKNTIQLNLSKMHNFQERDYMFYEITRLLQKVLKFVHKNSTKSLLEELFVLYYSNGGDSTILKNQIMATLEAERTKYLDLLKEGESGLSSQTDKKISRRQCFGFTLNRKGRVNQNFTNLGQEEGIKNLSWIINLAMEGNL